MLAWFLSSCILIAIVTTLRYVFRGKIGAWLQYALWAPVLLRLLIPTASVRAASPILRGVWLLGVAACALWLLIVNTRFRLKLRKGRSILHVSDSTVAAYIVEGVQTPCLCGLFRPCIYIPLEALENDVQHSHIIAHELSHYRQLDHVWVLLRCVCLALHWYNPLVWLAAYLSMRDMELSCDEQTLRRLGDEAREVYCAVLPKLTCEKKLPALFYAATVMIFDARAIRERIRLTGGKPENRKPVMISVLVLVLIAALACLIVPHFTARPPEAPVIEAPEVPEVTEDPSESEPTHPEEPEKPEMPLTILTPADALASVIDSGSAAITLHLANDDAYDSFAVAGGSPAAQRLASLVDECLWTQDEAPSPEPFDCWLTVTSADGKTVTIADRYLQYESLLWSAEDTAEGFTFLTNVRRVYDELEADCTNIVFEANNAKTAATTFINSAYGDYMSHLEPENPLLISDYHPVDREISKISGDGSEVRGCFHYTFGSDAPEGTWPNAELRDTGAYNGYWEFVLQKQPDGRWKCVELSCP